MHVSGITRIEKLVEGKYIGHTHTQIVKRNGKKDMNQQFTLISYSILCLSWFVFFEPHCFRDQVAETLETAHHRTTWRHLHERFSELINTSVGKDHILQSRRSMER